MVLQQVEFALDLFYSKSKNNNNSRLSSSGSIMSIPQGSFLGPFLFLAF